MVEEEIGSQALADEATVAVGEDDEHGVDFAAADVSLEPETIKWGAIERGLVAIGGGITRRCRHS
jgi:hypothetical protein